AIVHKLEAVNTPVAVLANFGLIIPQTVLDLFPKGIINIHPSLLPLHKGLDTHQRAIDAGDTEAGCSVHIVTEELDAGEVLGQARVPVVPGDDADTLAARVLAEEHRLYPRVLADFAAR
ncbi:MAG: formyltransferase family protein, partial [Pseudomonadota bacterium]